MREKPQQKTPRRREPADGHEKQQKMPKAMLKKGLAEKFPQFFADEEEVNISIPVGWSAFAARAFSAFAATGLEVTLASVA